MNKTCLLLLLVVCVFRTFGQGSYPGAVEGDYVTKNFEFESKEVLPEMKLHYYTLGHPGKGKNGQVNNAVLMMHGTTGNGRPWMNNIFGINQLLDTTKYYIVFPDAIGHGKSSKPSDGMHMRFPKYTYNDMVKAQYLLLTQHLGVNHLRLVMGTSMGGMHTWVWGYTYPDFMDALMPLASLPVEIAGRNRMIRKMAIDLIEMDPAWNGGDYTTQPKVGLAGAISSLIFMTSSAFQMQKSSPTREQAEAALERTRSRYLSSLDANDVIYAYDASRFYNPSPHLSKIKVALFAINSADDVVNPPELNLMEPNITKVAKGRYILIPTSEKTTGHGTHSNPLMWGNYLKELLDLTEKKN